MSDIEIDAIGSGADSAIAYTNFKSKRTFVASATDYEAQKVARANARKASNQRRPDEVLEYETTIPFRERAKLVDESPKPLVEPPKTESDLLPRSALEQMRDTAFRRSQLARHDANDKAAASAAEATKHDALLAELKELRSVLKPAFTHSEELERSKFVVSREERNAKADELYRAAKSAYDEAYASGDQQAIEVARSALVQSWRTSTSPTETPAPETEGSADAGTVE